MIIKNNSSNYISLNINIGNKVVIERFSPQEIKEISFLSDLKQIMNQNIFKNGFLSEIVDNKTLEEDKKNNFVLEMRKAIEKTNEYLTKEKE